MGIGKRQPDGKKIRELREQKGLNRALLPSRHVSRKTPSRYRTNIKPASSTSIADIAKALGATPAEIILSTSDETLTPSASQLKRRVVRTATDLASLASNAWVTRKLNVIPNVATAEDMRQLMTIVHRLGKFSRRRHSRQDDSTACVSEKSTGSHGFKNRRRSFVLLAWAC